MSGAGRLEIVLGPGGQEVPAGGRLEATLRVTLDEALGEGVLRVMVGWEQLGTPGGLHIEREVREGPWEAGTLDVPFTCQLREEPATPRGEPGAMWFVAARLGSLEHRVYFRLTPRGEGAVVKRDVNAFLSAAPEREVSLLRRSGSVSPGLGAIWLGALLLLVGVFWGFHPLFILLGAGSLIFGIRAFSADRAEQAQGAAMTQPVLELSALEFEPGDAVALHLSFTARREVKVRGVMAALVMGERHIELNPLRREGLAPEELIQFKDLSREQRSMGGGRSLAAGEMFEGSVQIPLPPNAQPSGLEGTGIVWRAHVRLTFEGLAPLEEEAFFRVRLPGQARIRAEEVAQEVEEPGGGW
jgi:hypothetical protein